MRTIEDFQKMTYAELCEAVRTLTPEEIKADLKDPKGTRSNSPLSALMIERTVEWMNEQLREKGGANTSPVKPKTIFELYFSDPSKPRGQRFLGAVLIEAEDPSSVSELAMVAYELGINPGGQVNLFARNEKEREILAPHFGKLLNETEGIALGLFTKRHVPSS